MCSAGEVIWPDIHGTPVRIGVSRGKNDRNLSQGDQTCARMLVSTLDETNNNRNYKICRTEHRRNTQLLCTDIPLRVCIAGAVH